MIIESSAVRMNARRSFQSMTSMSVFGSAAFSGGSTKFVQTAVATAQNKWGREPDLGQKQEDPADSKEDLMARFSQSRSIRGMRMGSIRGLSNLHVIRRQSIGYMLHQLFWGRGRMENPINALFADYSGGHFLSFGGRSHYEAEETNFSTEGTVVTASGKEISFNVEMTMSRSFYEQTAAVVNMNAVRLTDPLVIHLDSEAAGVSDQKFYFDLDADGHEEQISRLQAGSGFLALDKNGDGIINDGSELFGTASGNGFADLAQYDQDGNGWIDEADEIFSKLLIWQKDENGKDVLRALGAAGVGAIYLGNVNTQFSVNSETDNQTNAVVRQTGMFLYENGQAGTVQQIDLAR